MTNRVELKKVVRREIVEAMMAAALNELFRPAANYWDCLGQLTGKEIKTNKDGVSVFLKTSHTTWSLNHYGEFGEFTVNFTYDLRYPSDVTHVSFMNHGLESSVLDIFHKLVEVVSYIKCHYNPDGSPLDIREDE